MTHFKVLRVFSRMTLGMLLVLSAVSYAAKGPQHSTERAPCGFYFDASEQLQKHRDRLVRELPEISHLVANPKAFLDDFRTRFAAQKLITPENPRLFDVMDVAKSSMEFIASTIPKRIETLKAAKERLEKSKFHFTPWVWLKARKDPTYIPFTSRKKGIRDLDLTIQLLEKMSLPGTLWVEVESTAIKEDGRAEGFWISESAS